jgi:hypothetical protein
MTDDGWWDEDSDEAPYPQDPTETTYAQGRTPERTYVSRTFQIDRPTSRDLGQPARFVYKVFDTDDESKVVLEGAEWVCHETLRGRYQIKLLIAREAGNVKELWIQRVPASSSGENVRVLLNLQRPNVERLIELLRNLDHIPVEGEYTVRVDDALVRDLFANPDALVSLYRRDPDRFRRLISDDESARDVVAVAHRRTQVERFKRLLYDDEYFDGEADAAAGPEAVWQQFFEDNPWILGVTLAGQLLTRWSDEILQQAVVGSSISGPGKRTDALLRTAGRIRSLVFAEFKTHRTALLAREYRPGCWAPSLELSGGVAQIQGTVHRAVAAIGDRLADLDPDGADVPGEFTYLVRPKSYLIIGDLGELVGPGGGDYQDRVRSFELFRRHLVEPEVITFDELLARAEWFVAPPQSVE